MRDWYNAYSGLSPVLILLGSIVAICLFLSFISGWLRLAKQYRLRGVFKGERQYFQSGMIGLISYTLCLTVGVDPTGFYLSILPLFYFGHSPLLIPWSEITEIRRKRGVFGLDAALLRVGSRPRVAAIRIPWRIIEKARPWIESHRIVE